MPPKAYQAHPTKWQSRAMTPRCESTPGEWETTKCSYKYKPTHQTQGVQAEKACAIYNSFGIPWYNHPANYISAADSGQLCREGRKNCCERKVERTLKQGDNQRLHCCRRVLPPRHLQTWQSRRTSIPAHTWVCIQRGLETLRCTALGRNPCIAPVPCFVSGGSFRAASEGPR